ncbi:phage tail tip lysozyme [Nocardia arthritidis]|uniref:S8 family serine peptidase n=1 Tax=Nocardia arthritidis TaxID=228602 RepID=A0A6G9YM05_9NOCA|nr:phage tail tip lysozyme [Nocardia arthritidis]QIS14221.1 S8 family serine peptidase [Nocardia arthritidis]
MDPALRQLIEFGGPDDEVSVLVRLGGGAALPEAVRVVSRFGPIATVRLPRIAVAELRAHPDVLSVKAPRLYRPDVFTDSAGIADLAVLDTDGRRPSDPVVSGRGVVVGVVDWGLDFTHPAFRTSDGRTRLLALWNQQPGPDPSAPNRFGYGRIHTAAEIDAALTSPDPVATLGYDPALSDLGIGAHGTATTSIAAGSPCGGISGVAPTAALVFVHLSTWGPDGPQDLGDSVALVEAIDFIQRVAGERPWVINLSMGRHGGPHDGSTLVEQALDAAVLAGPGRMVVQSCGNYFQTSTHVEGQLLAGSEARIPLCTNASSVAHEVDLWYSGLDRITVGLCAPQDEPRIFTRPGDSDTLTIDGADMARIAHRTGDPNNARNEVLIRLEPDAPDGVWHIVLRGIDVVDGRYHAWAEREPIRRDQLHFPVDIAAVTTTTGSICNGLRTLTVGAYDQHSPGWPATDFSSSGPTVDGRHKPDLLAPGRDVLVARSRSSSEIPGEPALFTRMSGTSMAAPHVTGAVACLLEQFGGSAPAGQLRRHLLTSCRPYGADDTLRAGNGYLDLATALTDSDLVQSPTAEKPMEELDALDPSVASDAAPAPPPDTSAVAEPVASPPDTPAGAEPEPAKSVAGPTPPPDEPIAEPPLPPPRRRWPSGPPDGGGSRATAQPARLPNPDAVLRALKTTPQELFNAFVLKLDPFTAIELNRYLECVADSRRRITTLRPGDLLIRGHAGERSASLSVLVNGRPVSAGAAYALGWQLEGRLPGHYAWVVEGGHRPHRRNEHWARRISDQRGYGLAGQAVLRMRNIRLESGGTRGRRTAGFGSRGTGEDAWATVEEFETEFVEDFEDFGTESAEDFEEYEEFAELEPDWEASTSNPPADRDSGPLSDNEWGLVRTWQSLGRVGIDPLTADPGHNALLIAGAIFCARSMSRRVEAKDEDPLLCIDGEVTRADPRVRQLAVQVGARGEIVNWAAATVEQRILRVMTLLVDVHGFSPEGAAGVVGNLTAESGVIPNRVERSKPNSPMTAPDRSGKVREFTAEQVMNRSATQGPRAPGIGLAQWTSKSRRSGLFQFQNRGADILFDMTAQVAYLVHELRTSYAKIFDQVARASSADTASDVILRRFEVPRSMLTPEGKLRPITDPAAQKVLAARRRLAGQALRIFNTARSPAGR